MAISKEQPLRPYVQALGDAVDSGDIFSVDAVQTFDTVAQMSAATWLKSGMTCHTNGFHTAGDGGSAYYTIGTTGTANGMDVLTCAGALIATLVDTDAYVTPEQFGAYGDGTHDDTANFIRALTQFDVLKCNNTYAVQTITLTGSMSAPKMVQGGLFTPLSDVCFELTNFGVLKDVAISRASFPVTSEQSVGVLISGNYNILEGVNVSRFRYGYVLHNSSNSGCAYNSIDGGIIYDCIQHIYMYNSGASWCNENTLIATTCRVSNSYKTHVASQPDAVDIQAMYAVTMYHETATYNLNMNRFIGVSTEACYNGFMVEGGKNLFLSCSTEENTISYNFAAVSADDYRNYLIAPYDTDIESKIVRTSILSVEIFSITSSKVIPYLRQLAFDTSAHSVEPTFYVQLNTSSSTPAAERGIEVYANSSKNMAFGANFNYFSKRAYNFNTYAASLASLKELSGLSDGAMFYASDLHKHVTHYGGKWWDESGTEV